MTNLLMPIERAFNEADIIPRFGFLESGQNSFKLLKLQCKGEIIIDLNHGPQLVESDTHHNYCRSMLEIANSTGVDILMTPEYAFPMELISEILKKSEYQPKAGALWCLACQGVSWGLFADYLGMWEEHAYVVRPSVQNQSNFVSAIIYVFQSIEGKLVIVPQLKLQPMRDVGYMHEEPGLTTGNVIYQFGKTQPNQLCSILCSDAYHERLKGRLDQFNQDRSTENWIILHPQLNEKPRDDTMTEFRRELFNITSMRPVVYITANWAVGTTMKNGSTIAGIINTPWSCIYKKYPDSGWLDRLKPFRNLNLKKGLGFSYIEKRKTKIWHAVKEEHLHLLSIQKPNFSAHPVTNSDGGVSVLKIYKADEKYNYWVEDNLTFDTSLPVELYQVLTDKFDFPLSATIEDKDKFFGLCLGHLEKGELTSIGDSELKGRISIHIDSECDGIRNGNAENISILTKILKNPDRRLLIQLGQPKGDIVYHYSDNYKYYNVYPSSLNGRDARWVCYENSKLKARELAEKLKRIIEEEQAHKICVITYKGLGTSKPEYDFFPKNNVEITATKRAGQIVELYREE